MAASAKRAPAAGPRPQRGPLRPILLAAGLGLLWFVETPPPEYVEGAADWSFALLIGVRLLADFVGAWLVVSALRLAFNLTRYAWTRVHQRVEQEMS
jgi:hypothetical protein